VCLLKQSIVVKKYLCPCDEDLRDSTPTNQAQPSKRMTRSMTQDLGLGQDPPLVMLQRLVLPRGSQEVESKPWELSIN